MYSVRLEMVERGEKKIKICFSFGTQFKHLKYTIIPIFLYIENIKRLYVEQTNLEKRKTKSCECN